MLAYIPYMDPMGNDYKDNQLISPLYPDDQ